MAVPVPSVEQVNANKFVLLSRLEQRRPDLAPVLPMMSLDALLRLAEREGIPTRWWRWGV
jgi:hypothetical protein